MMHRGISRRTALAAAVVLFWPNPASADIGLPMVAIYLPPAWLCFVPIVLIEAYVGIARHGLPRNRALVAQAVANALSTGIGLPVTWILLAIIQLTCCGTALGLGSLMTRAYAVTIQAPWLIPYESDLGWMVPVAFVSLRVPFYAMSVLLEHFVIRRFFPEQDRRVIWAWVCQGNILSYALLVAVMLLALAWPAAFEQVSSFFAPVTRAIFGLVYRILRGQPLPF